MASGIQDNYGAIGDMLDEQRRIRDLIAWYEARVIRLDIAVQEALQRQAVRREQGVRTTEAAVAEEQGPTPASPRSKTLFARVQAALRLSPSQSPVPFLALFSRINADGGDPVEKPTLRATLHRATTTGKLTLVRPGVFSI